MSQNRKTLLAITDHPISCSGVATQARWLFNELVNSGKYRIFVLGAAVKHDSYEETIVNENFIIKPIDGFGDANLVRKAIMQVKPDALFLFTDPRFFLHVFEDESTIHQQCPIVYNHLWDNGPWPDFNKVLYESCDLINCINYPTYEMVHKHFPEKTNYVPHAVPKELYFPMPKENVKKIKEAILGKERENDFVASFISRNARRKMPSDILASWRMFLDELQEKHGHQKATLIMHTNPLDQEGPNLNHVVSLFNLKKNVMFSNEQIKFEAMASLYNISDVVVNRSCAEGFGLGILEAKMCARPVIAIKTGGLTRQIEDHETGEQYGVAMEPEVKALVGNQMVPYIYEDYVSHETMAKAFMKMYELGPEGRDALGLKAMHHAHKNYDLKTIVKQWDETLSETIENWRSRYQPWTHTEL